MSTPSRSDAIAELTDVLSAGGSSLASDYDLEAVVDECRQESGSFNLYDVPEQEFWEIISAHQRPDGSRRVV